MTRPLRVIIESPLGSRPDGSRIQPGSPEWQENVMYVQACMLDSLKRGEAPYASHALYPQCLNDATPAEREQGIQAGFAWGECGELVAVYADKGITPGMQRGIDRATAAGQHVELRYLGVRVEPAWCEPGPEEVLEPFPLPLDSRPFDDGGCWDLAGELGGEGG
jgi:hypothetical protein